QQCPRREPKLPMKPVSSVAHTPPAPLVPACSIRKITALMSNPALVLASLLIGGSLPGILHGQAPDSSKGGGVLTPGDSVWIMVWRKPEFTGEFAVAADGSISHPVYRAVVVGGVPLATAQGTRSEEHTSELQSPCNL